MKLCDVNIFINAHRAEQQGHLFYYQWLINSLQQESAFLYCEWVFSAFIRIVTHPKIYKTPTPIDRALAFVKDIRDQPNSISIMPGARHWTIFEQLCQKTKATGNLIPDAYLAALAIEADAEWITADSDFARFEPNLKWQLLKPLEK
ncbi:Ribonuclease VapC25 [Acaryochloris thomasi RCC1774]|uniref:Ribonuclease VapC n=1 Tax=Acaryochloris thomasi RCC1774 TaxID=1764569 RepID=A0A2W1JIC1_9CYAN|nr:type II toxin-antitoxin system VapC family toxin [Acaryochloris thomasi]PZD71295.1 Ribonuclease VapC25 [Acaryochloris thomasi RCC1774]